MKREELVERILDIKREKGWSWKFVTDQIGGVSPVLVVGALLGQMKLPEPLAERAASLFGLSEGEKRCSMRFRREAARCRPPTRFSTAFMSW